MSTAEDDFRGVGWAFPVQPAPRLVPPLRGPPEPEGQIAVSREDRSIRESILLIVGTARGERLMRPDFGCGIHDLVFASNDTTTAGRVSHEIREALIEWEPRAEVEAIHVAPDPEIENRLVIELEYRVRATNNVFNMVFPFFLEPGQDAG